MSPMPSGPRPEHTGIMQPGPYAPSAPPGPPGGIDHLVRPAKSWFVVAALLAVGGVAIAIAIFVRGIIDYADRIEDFQRSSLPAEMDVEITDTGGYSIYHEYDGADDYGWSSDPDVTITDPSGDEVDLDWYDGSITYSASGHEGEGLVTFHADQTGTYHVSASGEPGDGIAVGRGLGRGLVGAIAGSIAIGLLAVIGGTVMAIVVGVKRSSSRRALMPPPVYAGWGAPPPPGWGPGGPGGPGPGPYGSGPYGAGPGPYGAGPGGYGPGAAGQSPPAPVPPQPPPPPAGSGPPVDAPSDQPSDPAGSSAMQRGPDDGRPGAGSTGGAGSALSFASPARRSLALGPSRSVTDPPSLRAPVDWATGDRPLPWSRGR